MHLPLVLSVIALVAPVLTQDLPPPTFAEPEPPALKFLYTAFVDCVNNLYQAQGPRGGRRAIPIIGGNFTGPRLSGTIRNLGADWGLVDPQTGIFSADTRYNLVTSDGEDILLQTSGPGVPGGGLHLRVLIETGSPKYYWLNNVVAVGVLRRVAEREEDYTLRIDVWNLEGEYTNTTFVNGTAYS